MVKPVSHGPCMYLGYYDVIFTLIFFHPNSYDVVFAAGADEILKRFLAFKARVVISAEGFLWPDKTLLVMNCI